MLLCGRNHDARAVIAAIEAQHGASPEILARASAVYTHAMAHDDALRCCQAAAELMPLECTLLSNLAAAEVACGRLKQAESHLRRVIELRPHEGAAYYNLAVLKRWYKAGYPLDRLQAAVSSLNLRAVDEVPLRYALSKVLEDRGEYQESFAHLKRGADRRRASMSYRVESDEQAMQGIERVFDAALLSRARGEPQPLPGERSPLFVMGLPRSGTTLVDRILSSHARVASLGEIPDFEMALLRAAGETGGKMQLIARAAELNFPALGADYLRSIATYDRPEPCLIDKTPRNYLYLGLIALALPGARVVHMQRDPMDTCYALYKTLFGAGSPYTYDLDDLARYYHAYHRLMAHWRQLLPQRFLDVSYESLVNAQEPVSREILGACGLAWDPACLEFHRNPAPAATASAAQVREPIHARSVGMWKHYERELSPLAERLSAAGLI